MKRSINILLTTIITSASLIACSDNKKTETEATVETTANVKNDSSIANQVTLTADQYKMAEIRLGNIETRPLSGAIKVNGLIDVAPQNAVSISAPLGGYVRSTGLLPGQAIRKGQVIAVIENSLFIDIQQEYLESKSRLVYLEQELKRQQELRREEINAGKTLQQVSSEYNMQQARIRGLAQKLSLVGIKPGGMSKTANLYSPITGYVKESNVNMGKYVQPSDVLFELANTNDLHLALNVFEKDVRQLKLGQVIYFGLANETSYVRQAKIFLIGKSTGTDGTIPVHCHLSNAGDPDLLPGMYVKALIETGATNEAALPTEAIVQSDGKDYIFVRTDTVQNKFIFKMIPVIKGTEQEGYVGITLLEKIDPAKEKIVVKGAYSLLSALKNVEE